MLRDYQARLYDDTQAALLETILRSYLDEDGQLQTFEDRVRSVLIQLATGAGKTPLSAAIIRSAYIKGRRVWFMVPRNELLDQGSAHLTKWKIPHGRISAGMQESRAYMVHVVSKDTLMRRLEDIKNWPDLLIIDEAHIALDAQLKIIAAAQAARAALGLSPMIVLGQTATAERLDGRGLWSGAGGPYDVMVQGPSIPWLTDRGFLAQLRYYAPPIEGLEKLHWARGEVDEHELEELLQKRKVYGDVIKYYEKYGRREDGTMRPALGFCRSVKSSEETAKQFRDAGYRFESIDGTMGMKERRALIDGLKNGRLDGLTSCELTTYGLDVPCVEYGFSLRPTQSRALYFQMVGRVLRPYIDAATGYEKPEAYFFDHVNMIREFQDPRYPGTPLFKLDSIEWNFKGLKKLKRAKVDPSELHLCPHLDYQWCDKPSCAGCSLLRPGEVDPRREAFAVVDAKLEERQGPTKFVDLQPEEKRDVQDRIGQATDKAVVGLMEGHVESGPVAELVAVADELGWSPLWVYWHLTGKENASRREAGEGDRLTVNVPLLHEIARCKGFKPGKAYYWQKEIRKEMENRKKEAVV